MPLQRITHAGAAPPTGLANPISASATTLALTSATGYPTGAGGPFVIDIDAGTPSEEKILCASLSAGTITVAAGGRGWDGTSAAAHNAGTSNVTHVISSNEADDSNAHIYTPSRDDHTQYVRTDGTRSVTGGLTIAGGLSVGGSVVAGGSVQGQVVDANGVPGATNPARFVGQTAGDAPPGAGTWQVGDFVTTIAGTIWVCTTAGSPGTWTKVGASTTGVTQLLAGSGVSLSPSGGTGVVTVTNANPATGSNTQLQSTLLTTTVTGGAATNVMQLSLTAGLYWMMGLVCFRITSSTAVDIFLTGPGGYIVGSTVQPTASSENLQAMVQGLYRVPSSGTYYVGMYCTSGINITLQAASQALGLGGACSFLATQVSP